MTISRSKPLALRRACILDTSVIQVESGKVTLLRSMMTFGSQQRLSSSSDHRCLEVTSYLPENTTRAERKAKVFLSRPAGTRIASRVPPRIAATSVTRNERRWDSEKPDFGAKGFLAQL